jgi:GNAT superfamily N-acetyltransferase
MTSTRAGLTFTLAKVSDRLGRYIAQPGPLVPDNLRGQGIGTSLLQTAETSVTSRGARHCFLSTFEFQGRAFYEKHGYTVVGKLEGCPPGATCFWMRKDLLQNQVQDR